MHVQLIWVGLSKGFPAVPERLLAPHLGPEVSFLCHTIFNLHGTRFESIISDTSPLALRKSRDPRMGCQAHFWGEKLLQAQSYTNVLDQFAGVCVGKARCEWHSMAHSSEFAVTFARILNETKWASQWLQLGSGTDLMQFSLERNIVLHSLMQICF